MNPQMPLIQLDGTYLQEKSFVILESPTTERNPNKKPNIPVMDGRKPRWLLVVLPHKGHKLTDPGQYCSRLEQIISDRSGFPCGAAPHLSSVTRRRKRLALTVLVDLL